MELITLTDKTMELVWIVFVARQFARLNLAHRWRPPPPPRFQWEPGSERAREWVSMILILDGHYTHQHTNGQLTDWDGRTDIGQGRGSRQQETERVENIPNSFKQKTKCLSFVVVIVGKSWNCKCSFGWVTWIGREEKGKVTESQPVNQSSNAGMDGVIGTDPSFCFWHSILSRSISFPRSRRIVSSPRLKLLANFIARAWRP